MPEIRRISPAYWTDSKVIGLSYPARLAFIATWTFSDSRGTMKDDPVEFKIKAFPADDIDVDKLLDEIASQGLIVRRDGKVIIPNFRKHQSIRSDRTVDPGQEASFASWWNKVANKHGLAAIKTMGRNRKAGLACRIDEGIFDSLDKLDEIIGKSDFLRGVGVGNNWKVNVDFILRNDENWQKILEGKYGGAESDKGAWNDATPVQDF